MLWGLFPHKLRIVKIIDFLKIRMMNIELFREYCLLKKASTESFPFDEDTLVFKVAGKYLHS